MPQRHTAIVVTTIFEPRFLDGYVDNLRRFGREEADVIVIIDRKTPPSVAERCEHHRRAGMRVICPTLDVSGRTRSPAAAATHRRRGASSDGKRASAFTSWSASLSAERAR